MEEVDFDKLQVDKENENVKYNDEAHVYWVKDSGQKCVSVTTLVHKFTTFDEEYWSKYKALQRLMGEDAFDGPETNKKKAGKYTRGPASEAKKQLLERKVFDYGIAEAEGFSKEEIDKITEEILAEWAEKRDTSCIRGTAIHKEQEMLALAGKSPAVQGLKLGGKFKTISTNKIEPGQGVYPELLLSRISDDGKLRVAGQADLIIIDGWDVYVLDFKTNRKIDLKSYYDSKLKRSQKLAYPLNNIDDSNFWHYSLQLSTYAWMIQKIDSRFNIKLLQLIHYDHDGNTAEYECPYLKDDVERMLAYYKKQLEHEEFKKTREKINF